jgi:hypothetical protein
MSLTTATSAPSTHAQWAALAGALQLDTGLFIEGSFVAALAGETFDCMNPSTGQVVAQMARGQAADIDAAVASGLQTGAAYASGHHAEVGRPD